MRALWRRTIVCHSVLVRMRLVSSRRDQLFHGVTLVARDRQSTERRAHRLCHPPLYLTGALGNSQRSIWLLASTRADKFALSGEVSSRGPPLTGCGQRALPSGSQGIRGCGVGLLLWQTEYLQPSRISRIGERRRDATPRETGIALPQDPSQREASRTESRGRCSQGSHAFQAHTGETRCRLRRAGSPRFQSTGSAPRKPHNSPQPKYNEEIKSVPKSP